MLSSVLVVSHIEFYQMINLVIYYSVASHVTGVCHFIFLFMPVLGGERCRESLLKAHEMR